MFKTELEQKFSNIQNQIEFLENILDKYEKQEENVLNLLENMDTDKNFRDNFKTQMTEIISDHLFKRKEYEILGKFIDDKAFFMPLPEEIAIQQGGANSNFDDTLILLVKYLLPPYSLLNLFKEYKKTKQDASIFLDFYKKLVYYTIFYFQPLLREKNKEDSQEYNKFCEKFFHYLRWKAFFVLLKGRKIIYVLRNNQVISKEDTEDMLSEWFF